MCFFENLENTFWHTLKKGLTYGIAKTMPKNILPLAEKHQGINHEIHSKSFTFHVVNIWNLYKQTPEVSCKRGVLKVLQVLQENICVGVSF